MYIDSVINDLLLFPSAQRTLSPFVHFLLVSHSLLLSEHWGWPSTMRNHNFVKCAYALSTFYVMNSLPICMCSLRAFCCFNTTKVEQTLCETVIPYNVRMLFNNFCKHCAQPQCPKVCVCVFSKGDVDSGVACEDDRCKACLHEVWMAEGAKRLE